MLYYLKYGLREIVTKTLQDLTVQDLIVQMVKLE